MEQQTLPIFVAGMTVVNGKGETKAVTNQEHLEMLIDAGWQIKPTSPTLPTSKNGKRRLTKAQAAALSDLNLSESFGLPSHLVAQGENFTFKAKVVAFLEMPKRAPKTGFFPATQVEHNGIKFCILFDAAHTEGQEIELRLEAAEIDEATGKPRTRSGLTVVATA